MARKLKEAPITGSTTRTKLPIGVCHWRLVDQDIHVGYRRRARLGGNWLVRWYKGDQKYRQKVIGIADDVSGENGKTVLTYLQAATKARDTVDKWRKDAAAAAEGPPATVRSAIDAYVAAKTDENGGVERIDIRQTLTKHVLAGEIADTALYALTERQLSDWKDGLSKELKSATRTRIMTSFKAALNAAAKKHRAVLPDTFSITIKNGLAGGKGEAPVARDGQALDEDVVRSIVHEAKQVDREGDWEGDLWRFIVVMAAVGTRFSQVAKMRVCDVQPENRRLMVPVSKKGTGVKPITHVPVPVDQEVIDILLPLTVGRPRNAILLERWYSQEMPRVNGQRFWKRIGRGPWKKSGQMSRPWVEILKRLGLPYEGEDKVVPYALRHSSIVRLLGNQFPVRLVAALHDTGTATIERHYSAAIVDAMGDLTATAVLSLSEENSNVTRLPLVSKSANKRKG